MLQMVNVNLALLVPTLAKQDTLAIVMPVRRAVLQICLVPRLVLNVLKVTSQFLIRVLHFVKLVRKVGSNLTGARQFVLCVFLEPSQGMKGMEAFSAQLVPGDVTNHFMEIILVSYALMDLSQLKPALSAKHNAFVLNISTSKTETVTSAQRAQHATED